MSVLYIKDEHGNLIPIPTIKGEKGDPGPEGPPGTEETIRRVTSEEIAKIIGEAPESFDTLKEISDWINTHEDSAAAMNSEIQTNKADIKAISDDYIKASDVKEITYAEYLALTDEQKNTGDYYITDYPDEFAKAVNIPIDAISGISANNVQNALAKLKDYVTTLDITSPSSGSADPNDFKHTCNIVCGHPNCPTYEFYFIHVVGDGSTVRQFGYKMTDTNSIYTRVYASGTWSAWARLVTEREISKQTTLWKASNRSIKIGINITSATYTDALVKMKIWHPQTGEFGLYYITLSATRNIVITPVVAYPTAISFEVTGHAFTLTNAEQLFITFEDEGSYNTSIEEIS